jgi:serine/threonine-protein kinase
LIDLEWINRCPLFEPIRKEPRFLEVRKHVRERVREMWAANR